MMEAPTNLNATAQPIESNENKMSCRAATSPRQLIAVLETKVSSETLHIGMKVRHPQYGGGLVKALTEQNAEIAFDDAQRTIAPASSDLQPAEPTAKLSELELPLANLNRDTAHAVVE